ncbi:MAG: RadC family protein [Bdellovibrionales bacterium]
MTSAQKQEKPHYSGHRDRLRQRFVQGGSNALQDYELLELILFMAIPRRDVKPLAKDLIQKFGSFAGVMHAAIPELIENGLSENTAIALKTIESSALKMIHQDIEKKPILNSWSRLIDYLYASMAHETKEQFRLLFLNKKNELIADEVQQTGTIDHTPAYPREIMKSALNIGATAIILVHNHPSGDPTPSKPDIALTQEIIAAAKPFNVVIHDHIIISKNGYTSFKSEGLI